MSPEERVDAAILRWAVPKSEHLVLTHEQRVAAARLEMIELVRQTESDALDRAAQEAEQIENSYLAGRIRALKHQD